jgi:hypothetical protein
MRVHPVQKNYLVFEHCENVANQPVMSFVVNVYSSNALKRICHRLARCWKERDMLAECGTFCNQLEQRPIRYASNLVLSESWIFRVMIKRSSV